MRTMMIPLGLWIHVIAETIAVLILLLQPSLFESDEAISGLRNGAIAVALVGAAVLSGAQGRRTCFFTQKGGWLRIVTALLQPTTL